MERKNILSGRWYPSDKTGIDTQLEDWTIDTEVDNCCCAGIVPHAGWYYSGRTAAKVLKKVCTGRELIIIIGGHLPAGSSILAAYEDRISLPGGKLRNRTDLIKKIQKNLELSEDIFHDNTVEVVAAMLSYFSPGCSMMWLRAPADKNAILLAEELHGTVQREGLDTVVVGSTDLTHYGPNYGFSPAGSGRKAVEWVKKHNDHDFIKCLLNMDCVCALDHAEKNSSACSAGAAAAAVKFAELNGVRNGTLMEYITSYDIQPADSFVGYAGIIF